MWRNIMGVLEDWFYPAECAEAWWNSLSDAARAEHVRRAGSKERAILDASGTGEWSVTKPTSEKLGSWESGLSPVKTDRHGSHRIFMTGRHGGTADREVAKTGLIMTGVKTGE